MAEPSYAISLRLPATMKHAMDTLRGDESQNEYIVNAVAERIRATFDRRTQAILDTPSGEREEESLDADT